VKLPSELGVIERPRPLRVVVPLDAVPPLVPVVVFVVLEPVPLPIPLVRTPELVPVPVPVVPPAAVVPVVPKSMLLRSS